MNNSSLEGGSSKLEPNVQPPTSDLTPLVSIIIPNWNGAHHLATCLDALRIQSYARMEVLLVDNASTDDSLELLRRDYPEIRIVALDSNYGFGAGCNAGMRASQGDIVILLNNDTEADPQFVASIVDAFKRHPQAGMVASKVLLFDRRDTFHTTGDFYRLDGIPGNRGVWQKDEGQYDEEEYVFGACGVSAAYRRTMLDQIGLFDEDFFFSCEDIDLAWRAQLAAWQCVYTPHAVVYHKLKATGAGTTASYYDGRYFIHLIAKNYPLELWRKHRRAILQAQWNIARDALRAWRGAEARARLRGQIVGLLRLPASLWKRRVVQKTRRVSDEDLLQILTPLDVDG